MTDQLPSLPARIWIAIACFLRALSDARFASLVAQLQSSNALPAAPGAVAVLAAPAPLPPPTPAVVAPIAAPAPAAPDVATAQEGALHLLAILQREARLLDFCEEELTGFSDAAIGAAARLVHSGCRKALREHLDLAPVRSEAEGAAVTLLAGFDARANRLTGNIVGSPPLTGTLTHHGWRAAKVKLPEPVRGEASRLLAPAEVELS